jgi:hypothetical protein
MFQFQRQKTDEISKLKKAYHGGDGGQAEGSKEGRKNLFLMFPVFLAWKRLLVGRDLRGKLLLTLVM